MDSLCCLLEELGTRETSVMRLGSGWGVIKAETAPNAQELACSRPCLPVPHDCTPFHQSSDSVPGIGLCATFVFPFNPLHSP